MTSPRKVAGNDSVEEPVKKISQEDELQIDDASVETPALTSRECGVVKQIFRNEAEF
jgi:hypothetical protein